MNLLPIFTEIIEDTDLIQTQMAALPYKTQITTPLGGLIMKLGCHRWRKNAGYINVIIQGAPKSIRKALT